MCLEHMKRIRFGGSIALPVVSPGLPRNARTPWTSSPRTPSKLAPHPCGWDIFRTGIYYTRTLACGPYILYIFSGCRTVCWICHTDSIGWDKYILWMRLCRLPAPRSRAPHTHTFRDVALFVGRFRVKTIGVKPRAKLTQTHTHTHKKSHDNKLFRRHNQRANTARLTCDRFFFACYPSAQCK